MPRAITGETRATGIRPEAPTARRAYGSTRVLATKSTFPPG